MAMASPFHSSASHPHYQMSLLAPAVRYPEPRGEMFHVKHFHIIRVDMVSFAPAVDGRFNAA